MVFVSEPPTSPITSKTFIAKLLQANPDLTQPHSHPSLPTVSWGAALCCQRAPQSFHPCLPPLPSDLVVFCNFPSGSGLCCLTPWISGLEWGGDSLRSIPLLFQSPCLPPAKHPTALKMEPQPTIPVTALFSQPPSHLLSFAEHPGAGITTSLSILTPVTLVGDLNIHADDSVGAVASVHFNHPPPDDAFLHT